MVTTTANLQAGDVLIAHGARTFGSRVVAVEPCPVGMSVRGPRGGAYRLTAAGAAKYVVVALSNGSRPLLAATANVTVHRAEVSA